MGLEQLLVALERDAQAQVEDVLAQGRAAADAIASRSAAALEARRRDAERIRDRGERELTERALTGARRDARRAVLTAQRDLLERVFTAVRHRLPAAAAGAAFAATVPGRMAAALAALGQEPAVIRCTPSLVPLLQPLVPAGRASVAADRASGSGFTAATQDGAVVVDETLETRLERQRADLARLVLATLGLES